MKKILILSAGFGEGHNAAANGIRAAIDSLNGGEIKAEVIDLFAICHGRFNELSKQAYLTTINNAPGLWAKIYQLLDKTRLVEAHLSRMSKLRNTLARMIDEHQPHAVISTYPAYSFLISQIYGETQPRPFLQATIVTDSITVNSVWYRAHSDYFMVPNEETAAVMREAKVPDQKIKVFGFPVAPRFAANNVDRRPPSAVAGRRVLYMINSGKMEAPNLVRQLLKVPDIQLTVTVGRDPDLRSEIDAVIRDSGKTAEVFGWTERLPELLMSHHLLISKAGGATVQEAIAARTPMIVSQVVPGQEEGNARLLVEKECGMIAESSLEIARAVEAVFEDEGRLWHHWAGNIGKLSRPSAASDIARFVSGNGNNP